MTHPLPDAPPPPRPSRRGLLALAGIGVAGAAGGYAAVRHADEPSGTLTAERHDKPRAVDRDALERRTEVGGAAYVYEPDGSRAPYWCTAALGRRLDRWLATHRAQTGDAVDAVHSYGAWVPGAGRLWHGAGRAFDVASLHAGGRVVVSARHDQWRGESGAALAARQRAYWRLAAGLHAEFADVLTYLHDDAHANHIHVDTGRFGESGAPRFLTRSRVQVQAVQAMCVHVWGRSDVQVTGRYDDATRAATTEILRANAQLGDLGGLPADEVELPDGTEAWRAFMLATLRRR